MSLWEWAAFSLVVYIVTAPAIVAIRVSDLRQTRAVAPRGLPPGGGGSSGSSGGTLPLDLEEVSEARNGGLVSFNTRRIIALVVVLLASTLAGLLTAALTDSRVATVLGVAVGAVVGMVFVAIWVNRSL